MVARPTGGHHVRRVPKSWLAAGCAALALVAGCASRRPDRHVPPYARVPYEPFSRDAAVAIALREWRAFGAPVDDAMPDREHPVVPQVKPEREQGLWQRVGDYWWLGLDAGSPESGWTGRHDAEGGVFPPADDGRFAWSAAFVSYVMRAAGARDGFPYSASHWTYVDAAFAQQPGVRLRTERPEAYPPKPGDLICIGRESARGIRYDDLPARFAGHCDVVVAAAPGELTVVGGNVNDAVTMKHVPLTDSGTLATPDGTVVDARYGWFVVVRVLYAD